MTTQMLTNRERGRCPFARRADELFGAPNAHIARCEDPLGAGLKIDPGHDETLRIYFDGVSERLAIRAQADEDKDTCRMDLFGLTSAGILRHDRFQMALLALELDYFSIEAYLDLW